jgi:hypothetical protein
MRRRWCSTASIPGGICDRRPGTDTSTIVRRHGAGTIMRRHGASTSHRVPDRGISIGPGAITNGGPTDRVGTAARRFAITPRGGGLSEAIGTMIGVAPTSQTRSRGRKSRSRSQAAGRRAKAHARGPCDPPHPGQARNAWPPAASVRVEAMPARVLAAQGGRAAPGPDPRWRRLPSSPAASLAPAQGFKDSSVAQRSSAGRTRISKGASLRGALPECALR